MKVLAKLIIYFLLIEKIVSTWHDDDVHPLILTDYLERNDMKTGQSKSIVQLEDFRNILSYSGFFRINRHYNSSMFFWFVPSRRERQVDPLMLWLQSDIGTSSLVGLFSETGPFRFLNSYDIALRKFAWTDKFSMLYVDSPIGTGFSYTNSEKGYAKNQGHICHDLYKMLRQFFQLYPDYRNNDFYIIGEGFAAKTVISMATFIHRKNKKVRHHINLRGVAIGSGFCDPKDQIHYGEYLYQLGLLDEKEEHQFESLERAAVANIEKKNYAKAFKIFDKMINGDFTQYTLFMNKTGILSYYNYIAMAPPDIEKNLINSYVQMGEVVKAIHVGVVSYNVTARKVEWYLRKDMMKSAVGCLPGLLKNYRVLFWNGQLDVLSPPAPTEAFLSKVKHHGQDDFKTIRRCHFMVDGHVAGYVKKGGNLMHVTVRNAGHMIAVDQPQWTLELIDHFIMNKTCCENTN